jgi:hypothetical protein
MKRVALRFVLVTVLGLVTVGCAGLLGRSDWDPFASQAERRLAIRVENANRNDVQVRVVAGGSRHDLGMISARSFRQTSIPLSSTRDLRFEINPIAGRRYTTSGVTVSPCDRVELIVTEPVQRSFVRR